MYDKHRAPRSSCVILHKKPATALRPRCYYGLTMTSVSSADIDVVATVAAAHSMSGLLARWSIEIAIGAFAVLLGLLRFMGKNALSDIKMLKEERHLIATKEDFKELKDEIHGLNRRIDEVYHLRCPQPGPDCPWG